MLADDDEYVRYLDGAAGAPILDNFKNWTSLATFAVYTYIYPSKFYTNPLIMDMERSYCKQAR